MKKLLFLLIVLSACNYSHAQWTVNGANIDTNQSVNIGSSTNSLYRFNLWHSPTVSWFSVNSENNHHIFSVINDANTTFLRLKNRLGSELFKVGTLTNDNSMYMHLPKADSRVVIGTWGNYLLSEGHKFIVKDGSAKVEGDIFSTGSIGIGTMSFVDGADTYKLSVEGKIRAHGVKVYTGWADYVFEDSYELPTLKEVEDYINTNGHLKDIPSAEEVEENGIELGEMNKLLLQKIEELTLYTIQLKKEVDELKSKMN